MRDRLQKILSAAGIMSRRTAERYIQEGRITVNGVTVSLGDQADPHRDEIAIDGKPIRSANQRVYLMLNKPRGYVTTLSDERGRKTAADLVAGCGTRVWPVGRLDMYSEGLLLFTNDGALTKKLEHPSGGIDKEYHARVSPFNEKILDILQGEMYLDGKLLAPVDVDVLSHDKQGALLRFVLHEGKNRQIRRMCEQAGCSVHRLKRVREGGISLGTLKSGTWRMLTREEIRWLTTL